MPTRSEFEKAFQDVAEGRDPHELVWVGGESLPAIRVVEELQDSTSIMPSHTCTHLGLEPGATYAEGVEVVLARWREDGLIGGGCEAVGEEARREPVDNLERVRIEKLERIRVDKLERIVPKFKRMTIDDAAADAPPGDTDADGRPASSRTGDS